MKHTHRTAKGIPLFASLVLLGGIIFAATVTGQNNGAIPKTPQPDPDQNKTTSERATAYTKQYQDSFARRARFIQDFQASGQDATKLPQVTKAASYVPPQPSLTEALKSADLVIDGTITKVTFTPSETIATVRVGALRKASVAATTRLGTAQPTEVQVELRYSPAPADSSYTNAVLVVAENEPLLFSGDRAQLFLQIDPSGSTPKFSIQSFTGGYKVDASGAVTSGPGNPFASQVQGLNVAQFTSLVTSELSKLTP